MKSSAGAETAIFDAESRTSRTCAELRAQVRQLVSALDFRQKALVFCFCRNDMASLAWYLAALESGHAAALLSSELPAQSKAALIEVGLPIPDGRVETDTGAGAEGELIYSGPNVMMGYASCREDLALGDVLRGKLYTGDRARIDPDGFIYITGRLKRDAKLFGMRLNLDEIEAMLRVYGPTAVVHSEGSLRIFCEYGDEEAFAQMRGELAARLMLHHRAFQFQRIEQLPLKSSGKIDYEALKMLR